MANTSFDYQNNRINYSDALRPQIGYTLDFAVALTYSLDLEAMLGLPMSLGLMDEFDTELKNNPICLLEAIRRSQDKFVVFCNPACIALPKNINSAFALLEDCVFDIKTKKKDQNFHPKVWLAKYTNGKDAYLKLIISSRNLTFDRSLDFAVELVSNKITKQENEKNRSLYELFMFAAQGAKGDKKKKTVALANDLLFAADFVDESGMYKDIEFFVYGLGASNKDDIRRDRYDDLLIVSPFLSENIIKQLTDKSRLKRKTLITRESELTQAIFDSFDEVYVTKKQLMDESDENEHPLSEVHAKVYYTAYPWYLYIGSANATNSGFTRNVEVLVKMRSSKLSYEKAKSELLPDSKSNPFERLEVFVERAGEKDDSGEERKVIRQYLESVKGNVLPSGNDLYEIIVTVKAENGDIKLAPLLQSAQQKTLEKETAFTHIDIKSINEFFVASYGKTDVVVKVPLTNIPKDERDSAIYKSVIGTKKSLYSYIEMVLSGDYIGASIAMEQDRSWGAEDDAAFLPSSLYETMLKATVNNPDDILALDKMFEKLDKSLLDDAFMDMYDKFRNVAKGQKR